MRQYWSDVFTLETWNEAKGERLRGLGLPREQEGRRVAHSSRRRLLCYLYGHSKFIGALEATSGVYYAEEPRIWKMDVFPVRVKAKPLVVLNLEEAVRVRDVLERIQMIPAEKRGNWGVYFQGSPRLLKASDGEVILNEIQGVAKTAVVTPLRRPKPAAGDDLSAPAQEKEAVPREHYQLQALLLRLGRDLGMQVWVARGDRGREYEPGHRLDELSAARIPRLFLGPSQAIIESDRCALASEQRTHRPFRGGVQHRRLLRLTTDV